MRIVDQKKEFSIEFERSQIAVNGKGIHAEVDGVVAQMGLYGSKERAKEVFLDIHRAYRNDFLILKNINQTEAVKSWTRDIGMSSALYILDSSGESKVEFIGESVYYMPES